jgi:chromosomal replication initiation ATPase DnaA
MEGWLMHEHIAGQGESSSGSGTRSTVQLLIAHLCGISIDDLLARRGRARVVFARQTAMYLMRVIYGLSLTEIAAHFGRDRSTVSYACQRIEDLRDDPCFDHQLTQLERLLRSAAEIGVAL